MLRLLLLTLLLGCGAPPQLAKPAPMGPWRATALAKHPLVGHVWSTAAAKFVSHNTLLKAASAAHFVLLGEQHDHPDHHRLQAWVLQSLAKGGLSAVGFEMLDDDDAPGVARAKDTVSLASEVNWISSGWPDFSLYAPIFQVIYGAEAQIVPVHPTRNVLRRAMMEGLQPWPASRVVRLGLDKALPKAEQADLEEEIRESHCGHAPEKIIVPMATAQRVKDAWMAWRLAESETRFSTVLIAGNGHIRKDRGVPVYLPNHDPRPVLSVAFMGVQADETEASAYHPERYDFIVFTPRIDTMDPCEKYREQLEKIRTSKGR